MAILLVTYDLNRPGQDYSDFHKIIKIYPNIKLSESSYAIQTDESPFDVYSLLNPHLDKNDQLYIITLRKPFHGFGPELVNDWLTERLP
jgi:hypothetical protein